MSSCLSPLSPEDCAVFVIYRIPENGSVDCICDHEADLMTEFDEEYKKRIAEYLIDNDEPLHFLKLRPDESAAHLLLAALMASGSPDGNFGFENAFCDLLTECYRAGYKKGEEEAKTKKGEV